MILQDRQMLILENWRMESTQESTQPHSSDLKTLPEAETKGFAR